MITRYVLWLAQISNRQLGDTKYHGSMPCGFRQEEFFIFSLYNVYVKYVNPVCFNVGFNTKRI